MDAETILTAASPTAANTKESAAAASAALPKRHHFTFYDRASRDDMAAFAAAKVLLENAIAEQRKTDGRAVKARLKADPVRRCYVVRFMPGGRIATRGGDIELDAVPPLLGSMSLRQLKRGEHAGFPDMKEAQTGSVVTVRLAEERRGNVPVAVSHEGSPRHDTFDFTVVNGSVAHCIWTLSNTSAMVP